MIHAVFKHDSDGFVLSFTISGHAENGEYGHDIVCAAVSALAVNAVNSIEVITGHEPLIEQDEKEGYLYLEVPDDEELTADQMYLTQILLQSLIVGLSSVETEYKESINIEVKK